MLQRRIASLLFLACTSSPACASSGFVNSLPLTYEKNAGQFAGHVKYVARRQGMSVLLSPSQMDLVLNGNAVTIRFEHADSRAETVGEDRLSGTSNYLVGRDSSRWKTGIEQFGRVRYRELYPGVDAVFYGSGNQLEYDLIVQPGADISQLGFEVKGAQKLRIEQGDLVIHLRGGDLHCRRPMVYQEADGARRIIDGEYELRGKHVHFRIGAHDTTEPLVVDPVVDYASYLGGSGPEWGYSIATDKLGFAYVTGQTQSANFPLRGALQSAYKGGAGDIFITKLNLDTGAVVYSTYLGGTGTEGDSLGYVGGIAVDADGDAYITGVTHSADFPTTAGVFQPSFGTRDTCGSGTSAIPCGDAFVVKLNAAGNALVYSSFLGGSNHDEGKAIALDATRAAYVTGITSSPNFPTTDGAYQRVLQSQDVFVAKVSPDGSSLMYSTLLGGSGYDLGLAIAVDGAGRAHVTGMTESENFPLKNALQAELGMPWDVFVTKFNASGSDVEFSTLLGGIGTQQAMGIALDADGNIYLCGYTDSADFPVVNAFQPDFGGQPGGGNGFVTKLRADGSAIVYSTFLGGADGISELDAIAVDAQGNAYVTGSGGSDYPTVNSANVYAGAGDVVLTKLTPDGAGVYFSTFFGGNGYDLASGVAIDSQNKILLTGQTYSSNLTYKAPGMQSSQGGSGDAFVVRFAQPAADAPTFSAPNLLAVGNVYVGQVSRAKAMRVTNTGTRSLNIGGVTSSNNVSVSTDCVLVLPGASCSISATLALNSPAPGMGTITVIDDAPDSPQTITVRGTGAFGGDLELVSLSAGQVQGSIGSLRLPMTAVVRNNGPYDVSGAVLNVDGIGGVECGPCTIGSVKVGASATIHFTRLPSSYGMVPVTGTVGVSSSTPDIYPANDSKTISVAVPIYTASPNQLVFAAQAVGSSSPSQRIVFHGDGAAPFHLAMSSSADFSVTTICGTPNDDGCFADVVFTPTIPGARNGALTIGESKGGTTQSLLLTGAGALAPFPVLSPVALDLGTRMIGRASQATTVVLKNAGSAPLLISGIGITGDFAQTNNCPPTLATSASCSITVTFTPLGTGIRNGLLVVQDLAAGSPHETTLVGVGTTSPLIISPPSLDFGTQAVGTASAQKSLTITNIGGTALHVSKMTPPAGFQQSSDCASVAPDAVCHVTITFAPQAMGTSNGALSINDDAVGSPHVANLFGTGVQALAALSPVSLDLGASSVGTAAPTQFVALTNNGNMGLAISSLAATSDFSVTNGCGSVVAASATCYLIVAFTPTAAGQRGGQLVVNDNAPGSPHRITLSGMGMGSGVAIALSTNALGFGQVLLSGSMSQTITITSVGSLPLSLSSTKISGAGFDAVSNCPASLAPAHSCAVTVRFVPTTTSVATGTLSISDDAPESPQVVSLSGQGMAVIIDAVRPARGGRRGTKPSEAETVGSLAAQDFAATLPLRKSNLALLPENIGPPTVTPPMLALPRAIALRAIEPDCDAVSDEARAIDDEKRPRENCPVLPQ